MISKAIKRKIIGERNINNFYDNLFPLARLVILKYLYLWTQQAFNEPEYKAIFADKPEMDVTMSAEIFRYLMCDEDGRPKESLSEDEVMAKRWAKKWSEDFMDVDADFSDFVVQTLMMDYVYIELLESPMWPGGDARTEKVSILVRKYFHKARNKPNSDTYIDLLSKWLAWSKTVKV